MFIKTKTQNKIILYIVFFIVLFLGYFLLRDSTWQGSKQLHTIMETIAAVLALIVGTMALARFYSKKNNTFLFLGTGFLGTGMLDAYHAIVTSTFFEIYFPSPPSHLIPWSWVASRLFLSILLCLSAWQREKKLGDKAIIHAYIVYIGVGVLTITSFIFLAFIPLPRAYYPELFFHRPEEFVPAFFFLLALIGYLKKGEWKNDDFEHWLILSIIVGFMGQVMFMAFSDHLFDMMFNAAHFIKKVSYILVMIGLLLNMYALFKNSEKVAIHAENVAQELSRYYAQLQREIVERERAERKAQLAKKAAEGANHAKSQFLASMSHEIRTPLNGILGFAQILKGDKTLNSKQLDAINTIQKSGEHLLLLLNDILDMSKVEAGKMELRPKDFHLQNFLKEVVDIIQVRAQEKGIKLNYEFQSTLPIAINADDTRLRQVLINLLGNAVKFTDDGFISFQVNQHNNAILFQIEDTGHGIAQNHLETIFEPFKQVNVQKSEGTGLGLPLSKKLVEMMGGTLNVASTLNKGSTFWFQLVLPEAVGWLPIDKNPQRTIIGFKGKPRKILLVDDSKTNRAMLKHFLSPLGFKILEATDGYKSIEKALAQLPDVILMDLLMPEMDGFEATRQIRQSGLDVIIIANSASVFKEQQQESLLAGCNDFIAKPIQTNELLKKLHTHLNLEWIFENEPPAILPVPKKSQPLVGPPTEAAKRLYDLAMRGNVEGLIEEAIQLQKENEKFAPFATKLQQLADEFQMRKIREFIKPYLTGS